MPLDALERALCRSGSGPTLDELVRHERSVLARLREAHVVAIRLYSSPKGFAHFNEPMRDPSRLAFTLNYPPFVAVSVGDKYLLTFDTTRVTRTSASPSRRTTA